MLMSGLRLSNLRNYYYYYYYYLVVQLATDQLSSAEVKCEFRTSAL